MQFQVLGIAVAQEVLQGVYIFWHSRSTARDCHAVSLGVPGREAILLLTVRQLLHSASIAPS